MKLERDCLIHGGNSKLLLPSQLHSISLNTSSDWPRNLFFRLLKLDSRKLATNGALSSCYLTDCV